MPFRIGQNANRNTELLKSRIFTGGTSGYLPNAADPACFWPIMRPHLISGVLCCPPQALARVSVVADDGKLAYLNSDKSLRGGELWRRSSSRIFPQGQGFRARNLRDALTVQKRETWVDWKDIPLTAEWQWEIFTNIDAHEQLLSS